MKSYVNIIIILLICFLIALILFYQVAKIYQEGAENKSVSMALGNWMGEYFCKLGGSIMRKEDFVTELPDVDLLKHLPSNLPYKYDDINKQFQDEGIDQDWQSRLLGNGGAWEIKEKKTDRFWLIMRPLVHDILNDAFEKSGLVKNVHCPIIHFRCADTPFNNHPGYYFQKYSFFKDALDDISRRDKKYDRVIISYCNTHNSTEKNKECCDVYVNSIKKYLKSIGYEASTQCGSNIDDFADMYYAPAVISTGSSFSFMSGFFGKGIFISAGHQFHESVEENSYINDIGEWLYKGYNVLHSSVADYTDTDNVIKILSEKHYS